MRLAKIDDWEITREDKERQMRKARMLASPDNSDSEPDAEPPLAKLTKMKRRHRSGSSSEEDIPLLELQNRIKARNRQLKSVSMRIGMSHRAQTVLVNQT